MKESPRAAQAWADYLAMGPNRSLDSLLTLYQTRTEPAPTKQLTTVKLWSSTFGWQARLQALAEEEARKATDRESAAREELQSLGIASRQNRVAAANERWRRMRQVIEARATDPLMEGIPGGRTGLLVAEPMLVKIYDAGSKESDTLAPTKESVIVYRYSVDTGLLNEMRQTEKQAAQDLNQWTERKEHSGPNGGPIDVRSRPDLTRLSEEELLTLAELVGKAADPE